MDGWEAGANLMGHVSVLLLSWKACSRLCCDFGTVILVFLDDPWYDWLMTFLFFFLYSDDERMDLGWWKGEPALLFMKLDIIEWGGMKHLDEQTGIGKDCLNEFTASICVLLFLSLFCTHTHPRGLLGVCWFIKLTWAWIWTWYVYGPWYMRETVGLPSGRLPVYVSFLYIYVIWDIGIVWKLVG